MYTLVVEYLTMQKCIAFVYVHQAGLWFCERAAMLLITQPPLQPQTTSNQGVPFKTMGEGYIQMHE